MYYYFGDDLDPNGIVSRQKVANCAFSVVHPGDILGVRFYHEDADGWQSDAGTLFVKVISVTMPTPPGFFFGGGETGQVKVELPNGRVTDLLWCGKVGYYSECKYRPLPAIGEYFDANCCPNGGRNRADFLIYAGREADLKRDMLKEKERRERRKAYLEQVERDRRANAAAEAQRHASVSKSELDDLYSKL